MVVKVELIFYLMLWIYEEDKQSNLLWSVMLLKSPRPDVKYLVLILSLRRWKKSKMLLIRFLEAQIGMS